MASEVALPCCHTTTRQDAAAREAADGSAAGGFNCGTCQHRCSTTASELILVPLLGKGKGKVKGGAARGAKRSLCDCEEDSISVHCDKCGNDYCDKCDALVHSKGARKKHTRIPINEYLSSKRGSGGGGAAGGDGAGAADTVMCSIHKTQPLAYFCKHGGCNTTICAVCAAEGHKGHDYIKLAEASGPSRQEIEAAVGVAAGALVATTDGITAVNKRRKLVETSKGEAHRKTQAFFKRLQAGFIARMKVLQAAALAEGGQMEGTLATQKGKLEAAQSRLECGLELASRVLEGASEVGMLQMKGLLLDGLKAATEHGIELEPLCGPLVLFVEGPELLSLMEKTATLGAISGSDTNPEGTAVVVPEPTQFAEVSQRVLAEYRDCQRTPVGPDFHVELLQPGEDGQFYGFLCAVPGSSGSGWEGGYVPTYVLYDTSKDGGLKPPTCRMHLPISGKVNAKASVSAELLLQKNFPLLHPNVYPSGQVSSRLLHYGPHGGWAPSHSLAEILLHLQQFLNNPSIDDPAQAVAYEIARNQPAQYQDLVREQARFCTMARFCALAAPITCKLAAPVPTNADGRRLLREWPGQDTDPAACTAVGDGLKRAKVGKEATFVVTAVDFRGKKQTAGGDDIVIKVAFVGNGGGGSTGSGRAGGGGGGGGEGAATAASSTVGRGVETPATDHKDGTYTGMYTLLEGSPDGAWQLGVFILGQHIKGSPFAVQVGAGIEMQFVHTAPFDAKGVLHWIATAGGTKAYANPHEKPGGVVAEMSSVAGRGSAPNRFVDHAQAGEYNGTTNSRKSWMSVDLGEGRQLAPDYYCLCHGANNGNHVLRNWRLEGSNDANEYSKTWTILKTHVNDKALAKQAFSTASWPIQAPAATAAGALYRYFRILQTGPNSGRWDELYCAGIELYGLLSTT